MSSAPEDPGQAAATFTATGEWQDVSDDVVLPPGLEIQLDMTTGRKRARQPPKELKPDLATIRQHLEHLFSDPGDLHDGLVEIAHGAEWTLFRQTLRPG